LSPAWLGGEGKAVGPALLHGDAGARSGAEIHARVSAAAGEQQARVLGDVEAQFLAGIRRKDGRTVGLGL
jgi:endonuclease/exonuclease/phosphatase (EEP) superfamily protein YafD